MKKEEAVEILSEHNNTEGIIALIEAQAKVCEAARKLSLLYDGAIDTDDARIYETWRKVDNALAALDKHHG